MAATSGLNTCLGYRKASPLLGSRFAQLSVPSAFLVTPPTDRLLPERGRFQRVWNRLLDSGAQVRGLVQDRAVMGTPGRVAAATESLLAQRRHPQRVPVALLRRFFFFADAEKDHNYLVPEYDTIVDDVTTPKRAVDLSAPAVDTLERATLFVRERCFRDLGCATADDVALVLDLVLTTFERSVLCLMRDDGRLLRRLVAPLLARAVCVPEPRQRMDYWQGVPVPSVMLAAPCTADALLEHRLVLWAILVWRITASVLLERALNLKPLDDGLETPQSREHEFLGYNFHLYRDTHLDVLTHMVHTSRFSDEAFVDAALRLQLYPHAMRVLCVEELAKLSDVLLDTNIFYDSGVRKRRKTVRQAVAHLACKSLNQKCQMRELPKLITDYSNEFPAFNRLFKLLLHCALLGNLPKAEARPLMAARLRINASFLYEPGGPSTPLEQSPVYAWMTQRLYPLLFMLREILIYTIEHEVVLDGIMNNSEHWIQHKRITRACNGDVRRILSTQAARNPSLPFDWSHMERIVDNRNGKPKRAGLVIKYHDAGLKAISKMRKGTWQKIILKEITSCNTKYGSRIVFDEVASLQALEAVSEALHLCAWTTARDGKPIMDTRWLQVLGMSQAGFERVRRWIFEYYIYDVSDHGFVDEILALYTYRPLDYLLLRAYLLLHEHYCNERFFFLPIENVSSQMMALRIRFGVPSHYDTPDLLGKCYMCDRCEMWANPVVEPPFIAHHGHRARRETRATPIVDELLPTGEGEGDKEEEEDDEEEEEEEEEDEEDEDLALLRHVENEKRRQKVDNRRRKRVTQSSYMSRAWFNPTTGTLSCRRNHPADYNPMGELYAEIEAMAAADDEHEDGCAIKEACDPTGLGAAVDDPLAASDAELPDEDDDIFNVFDDMDFDLDFGTNAGSLRKLERLAAQVAHDTVPGTSLVDGDAMELEPGGGGGGGQMSSRDLLQLDTGVTPAEAPEKPAVRRIQRKVDPVDTFLAHYFRRNNNGGLKRIDMVGVYIRTERGVYGLCDEPGCGAMTLIDNTRMTNRGISCLHHVTTNMSLTNPIRIHLEHRLWKKMRLSGSTVGVQPPPSVAAAAARGERVPGLGLVQRLDPVLDTQGNVLKCFFCKNYDAEHTIFVHDKLARICAIPLCDADRAHVARSVPVSSLPPMQRVLDALNRNSSGHGHRQREGRGTGLQHA